MLSVITTSLNQSGFVKRRCEADSRWLPPDFSECVSKDYQTLFDKVKQVLEIIGALFYGSSGPGSSPGWGHCVVFLGKTLYSQGVSLHPGL